MFRNLLFDWSGTLCNDLALTLDATNYVLAQYGHAPLSLEAFREEFQLPYPDYYARKTPGAPLEELERHYRYAFDRSPIGVTILPHARTFLDFCRARGIRCLALTSMDPAAFEAQARALGLFSYFEAIHSGIRNKVEHIGSLMAQHGLLAADTAFIGDMEHDIHAARHAGITGIGVLTGYNSPARLAAAGPDLIVPDLDALRRLMERCPAPDDDSICIHQLRISARIGVPEEERATAQPLSADIRITPPRRFAAMGEDLDATIDYDHLCRRLADIAAAEPTVLLETLAHKLAAACIAEFGARHACVELHKYILPQTRSVAARVQL